MSEGWREGGREKKRDGRRERGQREEGREEEGGREGEDERRKEGEEGDGVRERERGKCQPPPRGCVWRVSSEGSLRMRADMSVQRPIAQR